MVFYLCLVVTCWLVAFSDHEFISLAHIYHIIRIRNKQDLYHELTDKQRLDKILEQALGYVSRDRDDNHLKMYQQYQLLE
jgi:hypothetical protein